MKKILTKEEKAEELTAAKYFMDLIPDSDIPLAPNKPLFIGNGKYSNFLLAQGKHGKICIISPIEKTKPEQRIEFYEAMARIAIRSSTVKEK